jgi:DNA invertase Pin-like site-specific DNA recombinase
MFNVLGAIAQFERELMLERQREALQKQRRTKVQRPGSYSTCKSARGPTATQRRRRADGDRKAASVQPGKAFTGFLDLKTNDQGFGVLGVGFSG